MEIIYATTGYREWELFLKKPQNNLKLTKTLLIFKVQLDSCLIWVQQINITTPPKQKFQVLCSKKKKKYCEYQGGLNQICSAWLPFQQKAFQKNKNLMMIKQQ